jgi:hypothetical protein
MCRCVNDKKGRERYKATEKEFSVIAGETIRPGYNPTYPKSAEKCLRS